MESDECTYGFQSLLFDRLKWPLTGRLEDIQVFDLVNDKVEWRRLFGSATTEPHPILREPVTTTGKSVIKAAIDSVAASDLYRDDDQPSPLVVREDDGSPVTIGTFIKAVHQYVEDIKEIVFEVVGYAADDTDVQFWYFAAYIDEFWGSGTEAEEADEDEDEARTSDFVYIVLVNEGPDSMEIIWNEKLSDVRESERLQAHSAS